MPITAIVLVLSFTLAPEDQRRFTQAAEGYVQAMLERDFRTLSFYKSLRAAEGQ